MKIEQRKAVLLLFYENKTQAIYYGELFLSTNSVSIILH